jgi:Arc/MetJ-type ribon-helix-helix transcriptional regulator
MKKSISVRQEKRGRPATGKTPTVTLRLPEVMTDKIDVWAGGQKDLPARSEAIRRLIELGLTVGAKSAPSQRLRAARADREKELASKAIDKMVDPAAPPEERAERRRRLTKGPPELRDHRLDQPKLDKSKPK